jgi:hypothetical protein
MFQAGVRCEGCHMSLPGHETEVNRASDVSCMACHGAEYRKIYMSWKTGSEQRTAALARQMDETARALGGGSGRLADARFNLGLVSRGHGVHNISYANALLRRSHEDMNAARRDRGLAPLPRPWAAPPYESPCFACHEGIESQRGAVFGMAFAHERHIVGAKIECKACHRTHEEKPEGEVLRFDSTGCVTCHHKPPVNECASCHADIRKRTVTSFRGDFDHAMHIDDADKTCTDCHDLKGSLPVIRKAVCMECHTEE